MCLSGSAGMRLVATEQSQSRKLCGSSSGSGRLLASNWKKVDDRQGTEGRSSVAARCIANQADRNGVQNQCRSPWVLTSRAGPQLAHKYYPCSRD